MPKHQAIRQPKQLNGSRGTAVANRAPAPSWVSGWRQKIRTNQLIQRLQAFSLDDPDAPTGPRMTRTQAQVALSLLRKVLPDMQALEITGAEGAPIQVQVLRFSDPDQLDAPKPLITIDNEEAEVLGPAAARLVEDEPVSPRVTRRRKRLQ